MSKVIAITGGIGSGKSTASNLIKNLGYTVISADEVYSELLKSQDFRSVVYEIAGVADNAGDFDRKAVADVVFADREKLQKLNAFTHQKVYDKMFELSKNVDVIFHEVPLLFESGFEKRYDEVIVILRDLNDRIESVINRSNLTKEQVLKRIESQYNYDGIENKGYIVIKNEGDILKLEQKIKNALKNLL